MMIQPLGSTVNNHSYVSKILLSYWSLHL